MTVSRKFRGSIQEREYDETVELVDWSALQKHEDRQRPLAHNESSGCRMDATVVEVTSAARHRRGGRVASGTAPFADNLQLEAMAVLLEDVSTEFASDEDDPFTETGEGQDWDDYTLVEVALFLQPTW